MNGLPPPVRAYLASIDALLTMTIDNLRNMTDAMKKKLEEEYCSVVVPPPLLCPVQEQDPIPPTVIDEEEEPSFEPLFGSPPRPPSPPPSSFYRRRLREPSSSSSSSSSSEEEEEEEEDGDSEFGASSSSSFSDENEEEEEEEVAAEKQRPKRIRNPNAFVVSDDEEIEKYSKETERRHEEKRRLGIVRKKAPRLEIEDEEEEDKYEMEEDDSEQDNIDLFEEEGSHAEDGVLVEDGQELASIMRYAKNYAPSGPWWDSQFGNAHNMVRDNLGLQGNNEEAQSYFDAIVKGCANKDAKKLPHTKKIRELVDQQETCCFCNKKKPCRQVLVVPGLKEPGYIAACCAQLANAVIAFYKTFYECARNKKSPTETFKKLRRLHGEILEAHAGKANFHDKKKRKKD